MSSTGYGSIEGIARFTNSSPVGELIVNFNSPGIKKNFLVDFIHSEKYDDLTRKCKNSFATILIEDMKKTFFSRVMRTNNLPWEKLVRTKQTGCEALP